MTANRNVRTGLTASAVISVGPEGRRTVCLDADCLFAVVVMEYCHARVQSRWLQLWYSWAFLVRRRL